MARILLIDDDNLLREALAIALIEAGHTVRQAADGKPGVKLFRAEPADLVITDIIMPDRDGIETIIALHHEYPDLPIIAMSGFARASKLFLDLANRLGARRTLAKPFPPAVLLHTVEEVLAKRRGPGPAGPLSPT